MEVRASTADPAREGGREGRGEEGGREGGEAEERLDEDRSGSVFIGTLALVHQTFLVPEECDVVSLIETPIGNGTACNGILVKAHKRRSALHSGGGVSLLMQVCPTQWGWGRSVY